MKPRFVVLAALGVALLGAPVVGAQPLAPVAGPQPLVPMAGPPVPVEIVELRGLLDAPLADHLTERLAAAEAAGAELVVLQLDLPAVLEVDTGALAERISGASVPVVAWVAPRGAEVAGPAVALVEASDAVFASAAFEVPVESEFWPNFEQASSLRALLEALDGRSFGDAALETWDEERAILSVTLRFHQLAPWPRLLHAVTSPGIALMLLLIGFYGLIFEIYNPGIGLAASVGAGAFGLSMYALGTLPANWIAVLVIVAGILLLVADVHLAGLGPLSLAGLGAVAAGSLFVFPRAEPALSLSLWMAAAALVATIVFFVSVMTAALRVRLRRPISGEDDLVGAVGEAKTDIAPEGTVVSKGTLWRARTMETGIAAGEKVKIMATEGLVLLVEPLPEERGASESS